jgi:predicted acylesterase/phospholipase RssA
MKGWLRIIYPINPEKEKKMATPDVKIIDIALQGGGAHGAFTWGVLDRLLEDERIEIEGISGTSAGAMNPVALAQGLAGGGRQTARELLAGFWTKVSEAVRTSPIQRSFFDFHLIQSQEEMRKLSVSSKLNAEWAFIEHLHDIGWRAAQQWLEAHFDDLGVRSSWDSGFVFEESLQPAHLAEGVERKAFK